MYPIFVYVYNAKQSGYFQQHLDVAVSSFRSKFHVGNVIVLQAFY